MSAYQESFLPKSEFITDGTIKTLMPDEFLFPQDKEQALSVPQFDTVLKHFEKAFGVPFEQILYPIQDKIIFRRSQQIIGALLTNELWRERFIQSGIQGIPNSWEEWQTIPITNRETLLSFFGGSGSREGLIQPFTEGDFQITTSGGTSSGVPIETIYTPSELRPTYQRAGRFLGRYIIDPIMREKNGVKPYTTFTSLYDSGMWSSGTLIGQIMSEIPHTVFIPAGPLEKQLQHYMLGFTGSKMMVGLPRELYAFSEQAMEAQQDVRDSLKIAMYGGGTMLSHRKDQFRNAFPDAEILSFFSSTQGLAIALQMHESDKTLRTVPGLHLIEIVDPDTGKWVKPGEEGELLITRLQADGAPMVRMNIGDLAILTPPDSEDQLQAAHFEFAGRSGDIIHIGESHYSGTRLYKSIYEQLRERIGFDLSRIGGDVQFEIDSSKAYLCLNIGIPREKQSDLFMRFTPIQQKTMMIEGLKEAMSMVENDLIHRTALEHTEWQLEIKCVTPDHIYVSPRGKIPLIKTVG